VLKTIRIAVTFSRDICSPVVAQVKCYRATTVKMLTTERMLLPDTLDFGEQKFHLKFY